MQAISFNATAKLSHYAIDGTGRDTYINFDNGGNYRGFVQQGKGKFQRGTYENNKYFRRPTQSVAGKPVHYPSDGTGRDTYIIVDQGGLGLVQKKKKSNYVGSLRSYETERIVKPDDIYTRSQHPFTPFLKPKFDTLSRTQTTLTQRLSMPKIKEDPYKDMRDTFTKSIRGSYGQWSQR